MKTLAWPQDRLQFVIEQGFEEANMHLLDDNQCEKCGSPSNKLYCKEERGYDDSDCTNFMCLECTYNFCKAEIEKLDAFDKWFEEKYKKCGIENMQCECTMSDISDNSAYANGGNK